MLNCSTVLMRRGRLESSKDLAAEALGQFEQTGNIRRICKARWTMGMCIGLEGDYERAWTITEEITAPLRERKQWDVLAQHAAHQGWLRCEQGRMDEAKACFERAQDIMATTRPVHVTIVRCLVLKGRYLRLAGEEEAALSMLAEAHALASSIGAAYERGRIDCELAMLARSMGKTERAQPLLDRAQRLAELIECEDLSWLGRGVLEAARMLAR